MRYSELQARRFQSILTSLPETKQVQYETGFLAPDRFRKQRVVQALEHAEAAGKLSYRTGFYETDKIRVRQSPKKTVKPPPVLQGNHSQTFRAPRPSTSLMLQSIKSSNSSIAERPVYQTDSGCSGKDARAHQALTFSEILMIQQLNTMEITDSEEDLIAVPTPESQPSRRLQNSVREPFTVDVIRGVLHKEILVNDRRRDTVERLDAFLHKHQ